MNVISIIAGSIFVVVLLSGLVYTMRRSHQMVYGSKGKMDSAVKRPPKKLKTESNKNKKQPLD